MANRDQPGLVRTRQAIRSNGAWAERRCARPGDKTDVLSVTGVAHAERLQVEDPDHEVDESVPACSSIPAQPDPAGINEELVPAEARPFLRLLSEKYAAAIYRVDALRNAGPHADQDREITRRTALQEALHRLHELREQRSSLLDEYDLPARAGQHQPRP